MKIAPTKLPASVNIPTAKKKQKLKALEIDYHEYYTNLEQRGMQICGLGNYRFDIKSKIESYY